MRERDRDMVTGEDVYPYLPEGFLLRAEEDKFGYLSRWARSSAESFEPFDLENSAAVAEAGQTARPNGPQGEAR